MSTEPRAWGGERDAVIAFATDCWLQDAAGMWINLVPYADKIEHELPNVLAPVNTDYGIERWDEAEVYDSDFEAARAVAELVARESPERVPISIWYQPAT